MSDPFAIWTKDAPQARPRAASRREFLSNYGMGFGAVALAGMLAGEGSARAEGPPRLGPHFAPKAKRVIWLFFCGGVSHMESFDPKPALNEFAGKNISETPHAGVVENPAIQMNLDKGIGRKLMQQIFPLQKTYRKYGQSGIEISDWWPHVGGMVDDLAIVRSMWTTDNNHQAQYQFLTGRNFVMGAFPSVGAWVSYGLGTLNENLPKFVVMGRHLDTCCGNTLGHGADYLGPQYAGVQIDTEGDSPLPFVHPELPIDPREQAAQFALLKNLNEQTRKGRPRDAELEARIKSYELAFRMQTAVPELVDLRNETAETLALYGVNKHGDGRDSFAKQCLMARRFAEQGVRFIQIFHGAGGAGAWDAHAQLKSSYDSLCGQVDQPIGALLADLKRRGMLDETLVVFGTEFGRTPGLEVEVVPGSVTREGRDHHPFGFSCWLAGGGIKGGVAHGATDELGFHAVEDRHYVTDLHATVMHQLGIEPSLLDPPGRKRIERDYGEPIREIIA